MKVKEFLSLMFTEASATEEVKIYISSKSNRSSDKGLFRLSKDDLKDIAKVEDPSMQFPVISFRVCNEGKTLAVYAKYSAKKMKQKGAE